MCQAMIANISKTQQCHVIQDIGKTVVLFKRNLNAIKINLSLANNQVMR